MAVPVSLQAVVDQMDVISDDIVAYINRRSGELVTLTTEDISLAEENDNSCSIPEWQRDHVDKAKQALSNDDYLELPDRFEGGFKTRKSPKTSVSVPGQSGASSSAPAEFAT